MRRWSVVAAIAIAATVIACGSSQHRPPPQAPTTTAARASQTTTMATTTTTPTTPKPKPPPRPKPNPGTLPQTDQLPSSDTPQFHAQMAALWAGVEQDSVQVALPAFFPEAAYVQVKGIADPQADYVGRLVAEYGLDVAAAHALLASGAHAAQLIAVRVPQNFAHWVSPGACYNRIGYYEVPNARVVYRQQGAVRSFGIASMISWRGVWYVVHLGSVLRASAAGVVDDPGSGPGESIPSSTC